MLDNFIQQFVSSDTWVLYKPVIASIILGGLIGVEREFKKQKIRTSSVGGIRTFMLISLYGYLSSYISSHLSAGFELVSLIALSSFFVVAQAIKRKMHVTSCIAAVITFAIGSLCYMGNIQMAAVVSVTILFILTFEEQMHNFVKHLNIQDLSSFLKFAAVTVVIYPLLPDKVIVPLGGVNLRQIWTMVIIISTIDFLGYSLSKFISNKKSIILTGFIGGLVSSTAVAMTFSSKSKTNAEFVKDYASGIVGASSVMFIRVIVLTSIVSFKLMKLVFLPCIVAATLGLVFPYYAGRRSLKVDSTAVVRNPFELSNALKFGLIYGIILVISGLALKYAGNYGFYGVSATSGLVDVDAITLSVARVFLLMQIQPIVAFIAVLLAATVNTLFKCILTLVLGSRVLFKLTIAGFTGLLLGELSGAAITLFWFMQ